MLLRFSLLAAAVLAAVSGPAAARTPEAPVRPVTVSAAVVSAAADSLTLLWRFDLAGGWHLYGPFRNDSGFAPEIALDLPADWRAGPPAWPAPERHVLAGMILDHVYHDELRLLQTIHHAGAAPAARDVRATLRWLVCQEVCLPGDTTLTLRLPAPADPSLEQEYRAAAADVPGPLPAGRYAARRSSDRIVITAPDAAGLAFAPTAEGPLLVDLAADGAAAGDRLELRLAGGSAENTAMTGLLSIDYSNGRRAVGWISIP